MSASRDSLLAAHPMEIFQACDSVFTGQDWLSWEPETLLLELQGDVSDAAMDKLLAVQSVAANAGAVLKSAAAFEKTINAFCNNVCVMDVIQPPEVEEISYGVSQIEKLIRHMHGETADLTYSGEVPGYVASVAHFRGWFTLPKNLSFAQERLDSITGLQKDSRLYKEHQHILETVSGVVQGTTRADARAILEDASIVEIEKDDAATLLVKRLIGALLYDPTLPYRIPADGGDAQGTD